MNIIGQNKLVDFINRLDLDNCPRSILLCGEKGCGKHLFSNEISLKLGIELKDITDSISVEMLEEISLRSEPYLYLIDTSQMRINNQNALLKFVEEPLKNAYIVILAEDKSNVLPTILNRCSFHQFERYTTSELISISGENNVNDILLMIARTPGRLAILKGYDIDDLTKFANKLIDKIGFATFSNMLKVLESIAFNGEKDKYDPILLNDVILWNLSEKIRKDRDSRYLVYYRHGKDLADSLRTLHVDKRYAYQNFLSKVWFLMRSN